MKIECIVTDDEPMARKGLCDYIARVDFLSLAGECEDALQLNRLLNVKKPHLVFLDIEMPYMNGMDFLATLPNPPKVIITSAYDQYALKGYELNVADYLLKPITFGRFVQSVNKIRAMVESDAPENDFIFVKSNGKLIKIRYDDIMFIESLGNYVIVHTGGGKEIVNTTIKKLLGYLPGNKFLQVHRSYVVNYRYVNAMEGNMLIIGGHRIPVSRSCRDKIIARIITDRLV